MKLKSFIALGLTGYGIYQAYQHRQELKNTFQQAKKESQQSKQSFQTIKSSLNALQEEKQHLQAISQDLAYKLRVFNQETQASLTEIQNHLAKYQKTTDN